MKIHYLEIVTPDVDSVCKAYEAAQKINFGGADELLGGARTGVLSDGSIVGVRAPLRKTETPVTRPYWLVEDIEQAVIDVKVQGAEIAVPPLEIPGKGTFAIYILGSIEQGLWQL
ncbi:putative Glyoxalase/Bleomycin resistance protein/Dihydroxybiphenyl dioxygenase [Vibrio nigripulchritudo SOn1]|uniref:Glyoxalase/Bleomycin resistance protein/Dihydroxybiphenyl dioxygenase n=1 Tax=Vibrio nigripulchritudo SOn1 TaxID=1238450 RepID=A0AAV2VTI0_9VIBR|nr:dihydroxybiphenyl dioxygenase [Vibrio nigripulchritudo]CCO47960.1 putative Glyoxalase/Bleomycin resistance protein/Dihydroxybiphenyl dioxygenase [Vibrio nigripulchritudo SOn1]